MPRLVALVVVWILWPTVLAAQPPDPRDALRGAITEFLTRHPATDQGGQVMLKGIGSWVDDRGGFRNPLVGMAGASDLDLTLVAAGLTPDEAAAFWQRAQVEIRAGFRTKLASLGVSAEDVARLDREFLTIYPPSQVMADIADVEDANALFRRLQSWPKPDQSGEGLYGDAARAWTQNYERTSGRVFVVHPASGRLIAGDTSLAHLIEGHGRWSLRSTAGLAEQLADHIATAMAADDPVAAIKQIRRLAVAMSKARSLGRLPPDSTLDLLVASANLGDPAQREIHAARARAWIDAHGRDVVQALDASRGEARVLRALADQWGGRPIPFDRIERLMASPSFQALRTKALAWATATGRTAGAALRALLLTAVAAAATLEAGALAGTAADEGLALAGRDAFLLAIRNVNLPAELAEAVLLEARAQGIGLLAGFQDCEDLVAGVFSVKGRERLGDGYQVDDLARRFAYVDDVAAVVERKAWQAASRGWTSDLSRQQTIVEDQLEQDVAESLTRRCVPPVLRAWDAARRRLLQDVWVARTRLADRLSQAVVVLQHGGRLVQAVDSVDTSAAERDLEAMVQALGRLNEGAAPAGASVARSWRLTTTVTWVLGGVPTSATVSRLLTEGRGFDPFAPVREPQVAESRAVSLTVTVAIEPTALVGDCYDPPATFESMAGPLLAMSETRHASARAPGSAVGLEVTGVVTNRATGDPLPGASVALVGARTHVAIAGADGRVEVRPLDPGDYEIQISLTGFVTRRSTLRVQRSLRNGTFALTPIAPATPATPATPAIPAIPSPPVPITTVRSLTFTDAYVPLDTTPAPQTFSVDVPGPGTMTVAIEYHQPNVVHTNYGAFRQEAWVSWTGAGPRGTLSAGPAVVNRGGRLAAEPTRRVKTVPMTGPATLTFAVMPEVTIAYHWNGQWIDLTTSSWATHHHLHGAAATVTVTFTPAR